MILLSVTDPAGIQNYLTERDFLLAGESVQEVAPAGEGNMNVTLKIITDQRTFILKQSRSFVAKYPSIPAPIGRIKVERAYLAATEKDDVLSARQPKVLDYDEANYAMILEHLDGAADMSSLYTDASGVTEDMVQQLGEYLTVLHQLPVAGFPENKDLRLLNHAHIFDLPFRPDNGFPLDDIFSGLGEVAKPYQNDEALRRAAAELGEIYLSNGPTLVHGDFYPGSLMSRNGEVLIIDGEFAHPGRAEFDLGVLLAHLQLAGLTNAGILNAYQPKAELDTNLMYRFQAVEIIRRLIGIAQLPVGLSLAERGNLLASAKSVLEG